jgi:hypothetical protein
MTITELDIFEVESLENGDSFVSESGDFSVINYGDSISLIINTEEFSQIRHFFSIDSLINFLLDQANN